MIGEPRARANGSELRQNNFDFIAGILIRPGFNFRQRGVHSRAGVFIGVEALHWAGIKVLASRSRNRPTSVTTPTAWPVPRSLTLVATAGLISTQTIFTQLGSMLPTAMECSMEPRQSTNPAPRSSTA